MPVNWLAQQRTEPIGPTPAQALALQGAVQEQQDMQQQRQRAQAERQILSSPDAVDPQTGSPTLATIAKLYSVNPKAATEMSHQRQVTLSQLQQQSTQLMERQQKKRAEMERISKQVVSAYDLALQRTGGNKEEAMRAATQARNEGIDEFYKSGMAAHYGMSDMEHDRMIAAPLDINKQRAIITSPEQIQRRSEPKSSLGKLEEDYKAGRISKADYEAAKKKATTIPSLSGEGVPGKDALDLAVDQYLAGDSTAAQGYGRNAQAKAAFMDALARRAKEKGISGAELASRVAEFQGEKAGQRSLGTRTATVEMAVQEAQNVIPIALQASEKVNRTQYPTLNAVLLAADKGTGGEEVVRLAAATNTLINVYARAISPTGTPTVSDKDHAREILSQAYSKGQYKAAVDIMKQEMEAARKSPGQVKESMREGFAGKKAPQAALDYLKAHPESKEAFKAKYGYEP